MNQASLRRFVVAAGLIATGLLTGAALSARNEAHGEIRATPPPQAFQTGGQLAVPVLKEIASTLHQMDARLERLEALAQKLQTSQKSSQSTD
jgi:hypothetical protein